MFIVGQPRQVEGSTFHSTPPIFQLLQSFISLFPKCSPSEALNVKRYESVNGWGLQGGSLWWYSVVPGMALYPEWVSHFDYYYSNLCLVTLWPCNLVMTHLPPGIIASTISSVCRVKLDLAGRFLDEALKLLRSAMHLLQ